MRKQYSKKAAAIVAGLLVAAQLVACGGGSTSGSTASSAPSTASSTAPAAQSEAPAAVGQEGFEAPDHANLDVSGDFVKNKETVSLKFGMAQGATVTDYKDNKLTKWLEETCNVDLSFDLYPASDAASKIRILISSGSDMPDAFLMGNFPALDVYNYGSEGAIIPLEDYVDTYGTYYQIALASDEKYRRQLTMPDGHIYSIPDITESIPNSFSQRAWINQSWLDKLGLEIPTTTDELYDVLTAFVNQDPNGNGKKDEIGVAGSVLGWRQQAYNWIMNSFIYNSYQNDSTMRLNVADDGKTIYTPVVTDEWRAGLSYMRKLCDEGLYSPLAFSQDEQQYRAMLNTEEGSLVGLMIAGGKLIDTEDAHNYVPMGPIEGPEGVAWAGYFPINPANSMLITKDCKNPGAAFAVGDALLSEEGSRRSRFGEPGVDFFEPGPEDISMLEDLGFAPSVVPTVNWGATTNAWWTTIHPTYRSWDLIAGQCWDGNPLNGQYYVCQAVPYYYGKQPEKVVSALIYTQEEADEIRDLQNTICTYTKESIARFITGDLDINDDGAWESYLKELDNMKLDRVMEINQQVYDRMYN
ncbi:extracellular solute-binding protein [Ruminococcaceae bacterium OttesenSCG-928-L11]|nr:extracellular solute-binding protein [Ruminococcaceae bacterium OttesenSCG-928-L11]